MQIDQEEEYPPTLQNLIDQQSLKWIFVGGKGGVGKTTCSSSLALLLAQHRTSVLLVSTDPAHSISDAFDQKFTDQPTQVTGVPNLFAMEVKLNEKQTFGSLKPEIGDLLNRFLGSVPGIDEAMTFSILLDDVEKYGHDLIIFDTAPTGHTLKMLELPSVLRNVLDSGGMVGSIVKGVSSMVMQPEVKEDGTVVPGTVSDTSFNNFKNKIQRVVDRMSDTDTTTFVCVCIPEYLSLYETERMIQTLALNDIDVRNIIVNQIVVPDPEHVCKQCLSRRKMQNKYLGKIDTLYSEDFHIVRLPQLGNEVRGTDCLSQFKDMLLCSDNLQLPLLEVEHVAPQRPS
ncbi:Get3/AsnA [Blattamonas nauphoetae]|uniref:Get3/AsnA n=1 Tax=Blattamonas nauphoetae TaxID=2049346 RepID=A0ABQ9XFD0_9EUKA|nr:Get3/AsnA [Blattamonas nauphoetae]